MDARDFKNLPVLRNISELPAKSKEPVLLHFTAEQWKEALGDTKPGKVSLQKHGSFLLANPVPMTRGGFALFGFCRSTRDQLCFQQPVATAPDLLGPARDRFGPGEFIRMECVCEDIPRDDRPSVACRLIIQVRPRVFLGCDSEHCPSGCRLIWQLVHPALGQLSPLLLTCECPTGEPPQPPRPEDF